MSDEGDKTLESVMEEVLGESSPDVVGRIAEQVATGSSDHLTPLEIQRMAADPLATVSITSRAHLLQCSTCRRLLVLARGAEQGHVHQLEDAREKAILQVVVMHYLVEKGAIDALRTALAAYDAANEEYIIAYGGMDATPSTKEL